MWEGAAAADGGQKRTPAGGERCARTETAGEGTDEEGQSNGGVNKEEGGGVR